MYFFLGHSVLCITFQLTGTVRATFQLTYISAYWDSPKLVSGGQEHAQEGLQEHAQVVPIAHPRSLWEQSCVF